MIFRLIPFFLLKVLYIENVRKTIQLKNTKISSSLFTGFFFLESSLFPNNSNMYNIREQVVVKFHDRGQKKAWMRYVELKKYSFFYFCSSPDTAIVKNLYVQVFGNFNTQNLKKIIFHILPNQKIHNKKYYKFQWHSLLTALHICACGQCIFGFGFCALLERRVDQK